MKAKIGIAFMVVALFLGTAAMAGLNTGFLNSSVEKNVETEQFSMHASTPDVKEDGNYISIDFGGETSYLRKASYPIMPYESKVMTFPFGTEIEGIDVSIGDVQTIHLDKKIAPAP
ncbi:MAG: hypothetical protein J7L93_00490, partial [Thermoplasmata archaeon]|nr:hypothetical protein [Thermoplasmata archaeon]